MVREIWFEKSNSRKMIDQKKKWFYTINPREIWFEKMVDQKKRWFYTINPHFFRLEKSG